MSVAVSGFYDEVSQNFEQQLMLASGLGESYICLRSYNGKNVCGCTLKQYEAELQPLLEKYGVGFSSLGSPFGKIKLNDDEKFSKQCRQLDELCRIAHASGCAYIRIFSFYTKGRYDQSFDEVVRKLKVFTDIASEQGIVLIHENEKKIYGDSPERCLALYKAVDSPNFKLAYDAANFIQCGHDPVSAYRMLKPYTVYYHIKDCSADGVEVPLGMGIADYKTILGDLITSGYNGFLTLEPHTNKYAVLRRPAFALAPVMKLIPGTRYYNRTFRYIDRQRGLHLSQKVTTKDVFVWQHDSLKSLLAEIGNKQN